MFSFMHRLTHLKSQLMELYDRPSTHTHFASFSSFMQLWALIAPAATHTHKHTTPSETRSTKIYKLPPHEDARTTAPPPAEESCCHAAARPRRTGADWPNFWWIFTHDESGARLGRLQGPAGPSRTRRLVFKEQKFPQQQSRNVSISTSSAANAAEGKMAGRTNKEKEKKNRVWSSENEPFAATGASGKSAGASGAAPPPPGAQAAAQDASDPAGLTVIGRQESLRTAGLQQRRRRRRPVRFHGARLALRPPPRAHTLSHTHTPRSLSGEQPSLSVVPSLPCRPPHLNPPLLPPPFSLLLPGTLGLQHVHTHACACALTRQLNHAAHAPFPTCTFDQLTPSLSHPPFSPPTPALRRKPPLSAPPLNAAPRCKE